jgi:uncharacterized membrane protein YfcA
MLTILIAYLLCGTAVGLLSGLFGIGGGIVGIPLLLQCFARQGMPQALSMHMAIGTMLAVAPATTFAAMCRHRKNQLIVAPLFKRLAPFLAGGSLIGTIISIHISALHLQRIFAVFLLIAALRLTLQSRPRPIPEKLQAVIDPITTLCIGIVCGLLGLGGGVLLVPYLTWRGMPLKNAIATATACIVPAATIGTIGYMSMNLHLDHAVSLSTGYVYWPAFIGVSIMSTLCAPLGAYLTNKIAPPILKTCFSVLLIATAIHLAR